MDEKNANAIKHTSDVNFHGKASEFFSIWIVNILLTIVTLGIYSAWAKVRTNRYFYSNTEVDGHRFSYLAEPIQILIGRLIGVALFVVYFLVSSISPAFGAVIMLVLFFVTPFLICQSIRFKMKMTGYRNVRFNFKGSYGDAFIVFVVLPIVAVLTLYIALPWTLKKIDQFIYSNITFGNKECGTTIETGEYYVASIGALFIGILLSVGALGAMGVSIAVLAETAENPSGGWPIIFMMLGYAAVILFASSFYTARIRNHLFNNTSIEEVASFKSELSITQLVWIRLTNLLAVTFTLGFAIPWVKIRTAKMFADATTVNVLEGAEHVMAESAEDTSAIGEEVSDIFDVDIAVG